MKLYKVLSVLLDYPDQELIDNLPEIKAWIDNNSEIDAEERALLQGYIAQMENKPLMDIQADYVKTFDMSAEHSLHLTHHLFGEENTRLTAIIDLGELYKDYGMQVSESAKEIPDYLPLVLEFTSGMENDESSEFLSDAKKVFGVLKDNLKKAASPYADLMTIISNRAGEPELEAA
jgi:nitrate reductase delta subunit